MSLLQTLRYGDHEKVRRALSKQQCERIAKLAELSIEFPSSENPAEILMKKLDRAGYTVQKFDELISLSYEKVKYYYPQAKVAILIANDKYKYLNKLATPSLDCDAIGKELQKLGFVVVTVKNMPADNLKEITKRVCDLIPEDSYVFVFYAGHGCQVCNTKCLLGVDCPEKDILFEHCFTENFMLKELEKCKLDLCVLIMDMCRVHLDRESNPKIYESMSYIEEYSIHKNLVVSCSCPPASTAYEMVVIECSTEINCNETCKLDTEVLKKVVEGCSQYVNALCTRLSDDSDISSLLDRVHEDLEKSARKQKALKIQCGMDKRSLHDDAKGDKEELLLQFQEATKSYSDCCAVY